MTELSDAELRGELVARGFNCGPVMGTARKVYEKKLQTLRDGDTKLSVRAAMLIIYLAVLVNSCGIALNLFNSTSPFFRNLRRCDESDVFSVNKNFDV